MTMSHPGLFSLPDLKSAPPQFIYTCLGTESQHFPWYQAPTTEHYLHYLLPEASLFPRRADRHLPRVLPTAGQHHTRLPQLPDTSQCDRGDLLGLLFPESKTK